MKPTESILYTKKKREEKKREGKNVIEMKSSFTSRLYR